jgi:TP53 regulating kinase-like protein
MEWINGIAVKEIINGNYKLKETDLEISAIVNSIGRSIARLHEANIIHGDLTTSNMLYDLDTKEIVFIDFGLSYMASGSVANEDKAVDLNVLERVFSSSHPKQFQLYREILDTYEKETKGSKGVLKRLEEVRMRGRKRDMVG